MIGWQLEVIWPLLSFQSICRCATLSPHWVEVWSLPSPDDIIMALLRHQRDIIMQHAAAQDHGTFLKPHPATLCPLLLGPGPLLGQKSVPSPDATTCRPLFPYWSAGPRQDPPMRLQETV